MAKKKKQRWVHKVEKLEKRIPINVYAAKAFPILGSKSAANKAIQTNRLFLNGHPAKVSDMLLEEDVIELRGSGIRKAKKVDIDLEVIYEDDWIIAINKPGGIAVNGNRNKTVENALADRNHNNTLSDALPHPVATHRIDLPTSGIVLLAKTKSALIKIGKAFEKSKIKKEYVAIVHGATPESGKNDNKIQNKKAITEFETMQVVPSLVFENFSLIKLIPITGRTHQLRIHMQQLGHFIVGDKMYAGNRKTILGKGLLLCARSITFQHPEDGRTMELKINIPMKFKKVLMRERDRAKKKFHKSKNRGGRKKRNKKS